MTYRSALAVKKDKYQTNLKRETPLKVCSAARTENHSCRKAKLGGWLHQSEVSPQNPSQCDGWVCPMAASHPHPSQARGRGQSPMGEQGLWKELTLNVVYAWKFRASRKTGWLHLCLRKHAQLLFVQNLGSFDHLLWALYYMHNIQSQF